MAGQPTCRLRDVRARASFDSGQILPGYRASAFISAVAAPASADGLPYSEGFGDVGGPLWAYDPGDNGVPRPVKDMQLSAADRAAVDKVCGAAAKCAVVVVSGRPLIIDPAQLGRIDALVASWLPGSEGAGVADTLFGIRPFTGRLPVSCTRSGTA
jgi:hypothetical protein